MIASDIFPGAETSGRLLARIGEVLDRPAVLTHRLSGSIVNVVWAVRCGKRELIAKLGAPEGIRREAAVLTMLRRTEVPVPQAVLVAANSTFPHDLLLLDVLPGHPAEPDSEVLTDAGRSMRRLHDLQVPGFGLVGTGHQGLAGVFGSWVGFLDAVVVGARQAIPVNVMPTAAGNEATAQLRQQRIRAHLAGVDHGVLLHGDLMPKHVWTDQGRLTGLIDWGDAMVGDPLFDLARFSMAGLDASQRLLEGYGGSTPDAHVLAFYRMVWSLMALAVECGAGGDWVDGYLSTVRRELDFLHEPADLT